MTSEEKELIRQVQQLAGRAFLSCLALEEHLKQMLTAMANLSIGGLSPADAAGILNGDRKLTSGQALAGIRRSLHQEGNWATLVEDAIDARNSIIHTLPGSRWAVADIAALESLNKEVVALIRRANTGVDHIRFAMKGIVMLLLREHPHLATSELKRYLSEDPNVRITVLPYPKDLMP